MQCPNCHRDNPGEPNYCQFCAYHFNGIEGPAPTRSLSTDFAVPDLASVGSVLKHGFAAYFQNFGLIFRIVVAVWLPVELIKNYVYYKLGVQNSPGTWRIEALLQETFATLVAAAIIFGIVEGMRTGVRPSAQSCLRWARTKWWTTIHATARAGFVVGLGFILLIVPGIVFLTWYVFVTEAVAVEDCSGSQALSRSKQLSVGHRWTIFAIGIVMVLVWLLVIVVVSIPVGVANHWIAGAAGDLVVDAVFQIPTVIFLMYFLHLMKREKQTLAVAASQSA